MNRKGKYKIVTTFYGNIEVTYTDDKERAISYAKLVAHMYDEKNNNSYGTFVIDTRSYKVIYAISSTF